jgi:two-component system sensor histidine kinase PilS (NtrC family)
MSASASAEEGRNDEVTPHAGANAAPARPHSLPHGVQCLPAIPDDAAVTRRRVSWLVAGRLLVATVLLGGGLALGGADLSTQALTWLVLGIYAASLLSLFWLQQARALRALVLTQIAIDLTTTTGLVWLTGGATSTFSFLYGVVILMSALIAGPRATAAVAGIAGVLYLTVGIALPSGWIPYPGERLPPGEDFGVALLRNAVGLFLVGWLANVLSERLQRAGGELRRAAESAAGYARLTEDIVRSLSSGLITTDLEGRIRTINEAGAHILGTSVDALTGIVVSDVLPVPPVGQGRDRGEGLAMRADGTSFPVGWTRTPLIGADGSVRGMLFLYSDLTEITELREKAEKAERLAVLGRLAAGLAHEIRNPLGSISGSVELVREAETLSEEDRRLLGLVLREVERLNELVTTMLDLGRPVEPERIDVDVCALAAEVVEVARRGHGADAGVHISLQIEGEARAHVDPSQMRQVLWNLIKNAVQFSARGGEVTVRVRVGEGDAPITEVEDRGPGIAAEDIDHVFDVFFTRRRHGVGLGLALVKQIVDAHGGRIEIESKVGEGTRVRVTLPPARDRRQPRSAPERRAEA